MRRVRNLIGCFRQVDALAEPFHQVGLTGGGLQRQQNGASGGCKSSQLFQRARLEGALEILEKGVPRFRGDELVLGLDFVWSVLVEEPFSYLIKAARGGRSWTGSGRTGP